MLLGMSHGWVTAEAFQHQPNPAINLLETVKSNTQFEPFGSPKHQLFPY
jgi:hypothetical protein